MIISKDYKIERTEPLGVLLPTTHMMDVQLLTLLVQHAAPHLGEGPGEFQIEETEDKVYVGWMMHHKDGWDTDIEIGGFDISVIQETFRKLLIFPQSNKTMFK